MFSVLTEEGMLGIMREEYEKRILDYLLEIQDSYESEGKRVYILDDAIGIKACHKETGLEFTISSIDKDQNLCYLNLPDQPRIDKVPESNSLVYENESGEMIDMGLEGQIDDEVIGDENKLVISIDTLKKDFEIR